MDKNKNQSAEIAQHFSCEISNSRDFANLRALASIDVAPRVMVDRLDLIQLLAEVDTLRAAAPSKKSRSKKAEPAASTLPVWLPLDAWNAFLDMRKKLKKPATDYAQALLLKKLGAFYANDLDPGVILNQSIMNGWQDLYAPKEQSTAFRGAARAPVADQNRANNVEALRLLGQPMFADDGMTLEAQP
jgi:hypothetical protein